MELIPLNEFILNINKVIFDLDIDYIRDQGFHEIDSIKEREMSEATDAKFVFDESFKLNPYIKQRFSVSYERISTDDKIKIIIQDNKNDKMVSDIFIWRPMIYKGVAIHPTIFEWVNNTLGELKNK